MEREERGSGKERCPPHPPAVSEPTAEPDPALGGGGMGDALQTRLDLKGLLPGAVSALQTAGLPSPPAIGKSRGKVRGSSPAPEQSGSRAEPLATRAPTSRPHLCSQGAGRPPGVQRGRMEPGAKARRGSLKSPGRPPRRYAGGGAVHPHPASAGSAGRARAFRGEGESTPRRRGG